MSATSKRRQEQLEAMLGAFRRTTYLPKLRVGETTLLSSKVAGTPWMPRTKKWPVCRECKQPMMLVLQINLRELPGATVERDDLVQLFHCGHDCYIGEVTFAPGGRGVALRSVIAKGSGEHPDAETAASRHNTVARTIVGFEEREELPGGSELSDLGIELNAKLMRLLLSSGPSDGIKLFGWPDWVQSPEWPNCPTCGERMELLAQLKSEHHIPVSFGDGLAYLTRCAQHPKKLAVSWSYT